MIGRTNIPIINVATDSGEYVRPVGAPNTDTIALNAPIINQDGINYYPIFAASAMDTFVSSTFTKTGDGVSTGADAYVFSDEPSTLYVGTSVSHTFNTASDYATDQSWKARYYIGYATEANKNNAAGITINLYNYRATYEFVGTQYLKLSSTSALFGSVSSSSDINMRYINIANSSFYNNTISGQYFCSNLSGLQTLKLPNSITTISGEGALSVLSSLASLTMPNLNLISGKDSVYNIGNVKELHFPKLVTINGQYAFGYFPAIETLDLPELTTISDTTKGYVLVACYKLNNLTIPKLMRIYATFASSCQNLKYFKIANTVFDIAGLSANFLGYVSFIELPVNFNIVGCNFTGAAGYPKSLTWFHHLATQLADRSSTTAGTMVLGAANIALIPTADAATIAAKNWTLS